MQRIVRRIANTVFAGILAMADDLGQIRTQLAERRLDPLRNVAPCIGATPARP
jgi:hypothetical protein